MKTITVSKLIKDLKELQKIEGDVEVFMVNKPEACFDGVSKAFSMRVVKDNKSYICLMISDDILKI